MDITDLTNGVVHNGEWTGDGVLDRLLKVFNDNINLQFSKNRLTGSQFAELYINGFTSTVQLSLGYLETEAKIKDIESGIVVKQKEIEKINEEINGIKAETVLKDKQALRMVEEIKTIKAETVLKDKQAVLMGLDKQLQLHSTGVELYTPVYTN